MQYLKIPKERSAVLIGERGRTKKKIEKETKCKVKVNNQEVRIEGDPLNEWVAKDIVKAIARGFSPEEALELLNEDVTLKILSLRDFCNTEKEIKRKKGRVIGREGKAKRVIEKLTGTNLSIYGKTIGVIGKYDEVDLAVRAIVMILDGSQHSTVYKFLEREIGRVYKGEL